MNNYLTCSYDSSLEPQNTERFLHHCYLNNLKCHFENKQNFKSFQPSFLSWSTVRESSCQKITLCFIFFLSFHERLIKLELDIKNYHFISYMTRIKSINKLFDNSCLILYLSYNDWITYSYEKSIFIIWHWIPKRHFSLSLKKCYFHWMEFSHSIKKNFSSYTVMNRCKLALYQFSVHLC